MKKFLVTIFLAFLFFFFVIPVNAQYRCSGECIKDFKTIITVQKDGSITVQEKIVYDFGANERHGIFRNIPYFITNGEGKKFIMDFDGITVTNEQGDEQIFTTEESGEEVKIKIGDPDKTITGEHVYVIDYQVKGALRYFSDHDELNWNATGNGWNVPIIAATTIINLPEEIKSESIRMVCYTGSEGSSNEDCTITSQGTTFTFVNNAPFNPYEGITVVVGFPKNIVAVLEPELYVDFWDTPMGTLLGMAIAIGMIIWYLLLPLWLPIQWLLFGRDPKGKAPVRAWYDPPKTSKGRALTPAEVGTLVDEKAQLRDISAMIVNLAQRGYFKIVEKKKNDFYFEKQKEAVGSDLQEFERIFLIQIFSSGDEVRLKDEEFYTTVQSVYKTLYHQMVKEGYFIKSPESTRNTYQVLAGLAMPTLNIPLLFSTLIFGPLMPRKTHAGVEAANVGRSMKNFLTTQERQLEFQAKEKMMFEKLLPFAIAFGVEKIWANRFKDMEFQPDWYQGYNSNMFTVNSFSHSLNSSFSSFKSAATPTTSSSGFSSGFSGGSSGGGGGGGGGGSW